MGRYGFVLTVVVVLVSWSIWADKIPFLGNFWAALVFGAIAAVIFGWFIGRHIPF